MLAIWPCQREAIRMPIKRKGKSLSQVCVSQKTKPLRNQYYSVPSQLPWNTACGWGALLFCWSLQSTHPSFQPRGEEHQTCVHPGTSTEMISMWLFPYLSLPWLVTGFTVLFQKEPMCIWLQLSCSAPKLNPCSISSWPPRAPACSIMEPHFSFSSHLQFILLTQPNSGVPSDNGLTFPYYSCLHDSGTHQLVPKRQPWKDRALALN